MPWHGRLLEDRVQGHDLAARDELLGQAPRVRDHVGDVVVDGVVQREVEAARVVRGADVDDLRARGHGVGPLDVERLLDVPALGLGRILREPLRAGRDDLAVVEAGRAVVVEPVAVVEVEAAREVGDVVADRRREERARDRDRLSAAVEAGGVQAVDAVRRVDLGRRVAAEEPRQRARAVRVRERRRGALAPVARAGPDGRAGGRRGGVSTFGCASAIAPSRPVIALTSGATAAGTTGSWFGARRTEPSTRYMFSFTPNACSTLDTEPSAVTNRRFAGTPTIEKPSDESQLPDGRHVARRRREAGVELVRREPLVVARRRGVVEAGERPIEIAVSAPAEPDREDHVVGVGVGPGQVRGARPDRLGVGDGHLPLRVRGGRREQAEDRAQRAHRQGRPQPSAHLPLDRSERRSSALPIG